MVRRRSESQQQLGAFETADDRGREARAVGAVGDAVVERQRQRQQQPRLDPALAYDGLLPGAGDAEDRDLRIVDDRDGAGAAEGADVGDREGATAQVVERQHRRPRDRKSTRLNSSHGYISY